MKQFFHILARIRVARAQGNRHVFVFVHHVPKYLEFFGFQVDYWGDCFLGYKKVLIQW
jgi:hypothetical protein